MIDYKKNKWQDLYGYRKKSCKIIDDLKDDFIGFIGGLKYYGIALASKLLINTDKYSSDLKEVSSIIGRSYGDILIANLAYELSQFGDYVAGCSSVAKKIDGVMHHFRNLEWGMPILKKNVVVIDFGAYQAISFPGYIGVLTGIKKGAFSISINQAPAIDMFPNLKNMPIAILVRKVLDECKTYGEAKKMLRKHGSIFPAFVHLVGLNESCVIECMPNNKNKIINSNAVTNHYLGRSNKDIDEDWLEYSKDRFNVINKSNKDNVRKAIKSVRDEDTIYSCEMIPQNGKMVY